MVKSLFKGVHVIILSDRNNQQKLNTMWQKTSANILTMLIKVTDIRHNLFGEPSIITMLEPRTSG